MQFRGGQDEEQVLRRLLQDLQQGVEGRRREHVDLIDDIHPLFHIGRGIDGLVPQGPHLVNTVVGGSVQLQYIQKAPVVDTQARRAGVAGIPVHWMLAVYRLGQDFGTGRLAGAPGTGKQVCVGSAAFRHLFFQGLRNVFLADDVGKRLGPPLAIQCLIQRRQPPFHKKDPPYAAAEPAPSRHMEHPA